MTPDDVNRLICSVRWANGILQLLDQHKDNPKITLGEIQQQFESGFSVNPCQTWFYFYNQDQLLTSLAAYICLPSEKFHDQLPETKLNELNSKWGLTDREEQVTLRDLIKFLRNAISHGNVDVTQDLIFTFQARNDKPYTQKMKLDCFSIDGRSLHNFCQALNFWCLTSDASLAQLNV